MLSVAEVTRRKAQPRGTVRVTSRSFQKSCGNQKVSEFVFRGTHSFCSRAVTLGMFAVYSVSVIPPGYRMGDAAAQVGHRTERDSALYEAPSWIHAPP